MVRPVCPLVSTVWTAPASTWPQSIVHDSPLSPASEYWYFDYCGLAGTFTWISNRPPSLFGLIMMKHIYLGFLAQGRLPDCSKLWDRHSWSRSCDLLLLLLPFYSQQEPGWLHLRGESDKACSFSPLSGHHSASPCPAPCKHLPCTTDTWHVNTPLHVQLDKLIRKLNLVLCLLPAWAEPVTLITQKCVILLITLAQSKLLAFSSFVAITALSGKDVAWRKHSHWSFSFTLTRCCSISQAL